MNDTPNWTREGLHLAVDLPPLFEQDARLHRGGVRVGGRLMRSEDLVRESGEAMRGDDANARSRVSHEQREAVRS